MRDISEEVKTYQSAQDVAKELKISKVTLKKHSLLIEKLSKGNVQFERNGDRSRLYTVPDVRFIRRTLEMHEQNGLTYEKAVKSILIEDGILNDPNEPSDRTPVEPSKNELDGTANALLAVLKEQNDQINNLIKANSELVKSNSDLVESNKELSDQMKEFFEEKKALEEGKEYPQKEKKWWQLFKSSN